LIPFYTPEPEETTFIPKKRGANPRKGRLPTLEFIDFNEKRGESSKRAASHPSIIDFNEKKASFTEIP